MAKRMERERPRGRRKKNQKIVKEENYKVIIKREDEMGSKAVRGSTQKGIHTVPFHPVTRSAVVSLESLSSVTAEEAERKQLRLAERGRRENLTWKVDDHWVVFFARFCFF